MDRAGQGLTLGRRVVDLSARGLPLRSIAVHADEQLRATLVGEVSPIPQIGVEIIGPSQEAHNALACQDALHAQGDRQVDILLDRPPAANAAGLAATVPGVEHNDPVARRQA